MVTFGNGCQFPVFIWLFYFIFVSPEGGSVLALRRLGHYEIPDNYENLSTDDLTPPSEIPLMKPLDSGTQEFGKKEPESSSYTNEKTPEKESPSLRMPIARWLLPPPFENKLLQDLLRHQLVTTLSPLREEYRIDVQDLMNKEEPITNQNDNYGSQYDFLRKRSSGRVVFPLEHIFQPSELLLEDEASPEEAKQDKLKEKNTLYYPYKEITVKKNLYENNQPVKRWWGAYYRPRPQMDRRAAQSKHYGCLKRCISIGKLHPIQCHTLC